MFKNTYETAWQVVLALVSHQKPLAIFRKIASQPEFSQVGATEPLKYADTRFGTKVIMGCRLLSTKSIYRNLFVHPELEAWVERQKPQTQDKFKKVSAVVLSDTNFWKNLDMCSRIFEMVGPAFKTMKSEFVAWQEAIRAKKVRSA